MEKRVVLKEKKSGLSISDVILVGVLLAVGVVLKFFVGSMFTVMKPNFIIAMYCLAILLIRPKFREAIIIGVLAGALCQVFPGTPYINVVSEPIGAMVMVLLVYLPIEIGKFSLKPIIGTFISTLASGFSFIGILYAAFYAGASVETIPIGVFITIILGTAVLNAVIVQILYIPLKLALGRVEAEATN